MFEAFKQLIFLLLSYLSYEIMSGDRDKSNTSAIRQITRSGDSGDKTVRQAVVCWGYVSDKDNNGQTRNSWLAHGHLHLMWSTRGWRVSEPVLT